MTSRRGALLGYASRERYDIDFVRVNSGNDSFACSIRVAVSQYASSFLPASLRRTIR